MRAARRGESVEDAVTRALEAAQQEAANAAETEASAAETATAASSVFDEGKAIHAEGSAEYEQLRKAAATAENSRRLAARETVDNRTASALLERAAEARDGRDAGIPEWEIELPLVEEAPESEVPTRS